MNNEPVPQMPGPKASPWKKILMWGSSLLVIFLLCGFGVFAFALWGGSGEPATLAVPIRVDQEFLQNIHDQQIDSAYALLSEILIPHISKEQFVALIQKDKTIFSSYKKFDVCDWGFFISIGRVLTSSGLLFYNGGEIIVEITLHKDADSVWRIQGFKFRSDLDPKPYGFCK